MGATHGPLTKPARLPARCPHHKGTHIALLPGCLEPGRRERETRQKEQSPPKLCGLTAGRWDVGLQARWGSGGRPCRPQAGVQSEPGGPGWAGRVCNAAVTKRGGRGPDAAGPGAREEAVRNTPGSAQKIQAGGQTRVICVRSPRSRPPQKCERGAALLSSSSAAYWLPFDSAHSCPQIQPSGSSSKDQSQRSLRTAPVTAARCLPLGHSRGAALELPWLLQALIIADSTKYEGGSHLTEEWPFACFRLQVPMAPMSKEEPFGNRPVFSYFLCRASALSECNYGNK